MQSVRTCCGVLYYLRTGAAASLLFPSPFYIQTVTSVPRTKVLPVCILGVGAPLLLTWTLNSVLLFCRVENIINSYGALGMASGHLWKSSVRKEVRVDRRQAEVVLEM